MNIPEFYDYLARARRDLWPALEALPDDVLSRHVIPGERFKSIKDLVAHTAAVEDSWLHEDILRASPVWDGTPELKTVLEDALGEPHFDAVPVGVLIRYWQAVEAATLVYLARLTPEEEARLVTTPVDEADRRLQVSGLLWHVMVHEVRHTAQIALLIRQAGLKPPTLDLLWRLPTF